MQAVVADGVVSCVCVLVTAITLQKWLDCK